MTINIGNYPLERHAQGVIDNVFTIGKSESARDKEMKCGKLQIFCVCKIKHIFLLPPFSNMAAIFIFITEILTLYDVI